MVFYVDVVNLIKIRFKVRDYDTGDPISGAKVVVYADGEKIGESLTDSDGLSDWFTVTEGKWITAEVSKECYETAELKGFTVTDDYDNQAITVYLTKIETIPVDIVFRFKVADYETGDPISGARVVVYADGKEVGTGYTGSDGLTGWFAVKEGSWVSGEISKDGYETEELKGFTATKDYDKQIITVYLTKVTLKGDIKITVYNWKGDIIEAEVYRKVNGQWSDKKTTKDGVVVYEDLPYGTYEFKAVSSDYGEKTFIVTLDEPTKEVEVTLGTSKSSVKFYVYYEIREGLFTVHKEPLVGAEVQMWCDEIGYDKTVVVDDKGYADFGEVEPCHIYKYRITKTGYATFDSQIHPAAGKSHLIEVKMVTEEEAECPPLFSAIANLFGISCDEARAILFGIAGLFVVAVILGILF